MPELPKPRDPILRVVACDQAGVYGPDRCADDPVGLQAGLMQGFVHAGLIGPERTATLQDENDLTGKACFGDLHHDSPNAAARAAPLQCFRAERAWD